MSSNLPPLEAPSNFFIQILDMLREQNKMVASLAASQARTEEVMRQSVVQGAAFQSGLGDLKKDLELHKKDAITWGKLGKGLAVIGLVMSVTLGVLNVLGKFNLI